MTVFSKEEEILFIHVPKTGGSSVLDFLRKRIAWDDYEYLLAKHATALELKRRLKQWFDSCFKFSIVRNPWERVVSAYFFKLSNTPIVEPCTFEQFVLAPESLSCTRSNGEKVPLVEQPVLKSHSYFLCDNKKLLVDRLLRFENLSHEWEALCKERGWEGGYKALPKTNAQDRSCYEGLYTRELEDIVGERYKEDVELFNYSCPAVLRD